MRNVIGLVLLIAINAAAMASEGLALTGGTIIKATGESPIVGSMVLIDNGRISKISADTSVPPGYQQIDVKGKWITPGLIDSNVHLILMTVPEFFIKYEDQLTDIAIQSAQVGLKYGLTTMPDTWGPLKPLLEARDRINNGEFVGSRVLVAGNIIGTGGPFSQSFMGGWPANGLTLRYSGWVKPAIQRRIDALWEDDVGPAMVAMTPEEAATTLRNYIAKGVDFVKVGVSGHGLGGAEPLLFSREALVAMREEARIADIPFTTHTFTVESLRLAVELEPDLLVHPNVMNPPWRYASQLQKESILLSIKTIAEKGIYAGLMSIPEKEKSRIYAEWDFREHTDEPYLNEIMVNRQLGMAATTFKERAVGTRVWLDGGVKFTLATDQGPDTADLGPVVWGRLGRMHFNRMIGLQDVGASPMDILIAATRNGAEAYGLGDELGTVEEGKIADLLVLDANPLADIANMRKINMVIKDGQIIDRESLPTVKVLDYDSDLAWPY
jgi:imidazolonepropionase-like amidohydrolase